jgi:hypothetical protein
MKSSKASNRLGDIVSPNGSRGLGESPSNQGARQRPAIRHEQASPSARAVPIQPELNLWKPSSCSQPGHTHQQQVQKSSQNEASESAGPAAALIALIGAAVLIGGIISASNNLADKGTSQQRDHEVSMMDIKEVPPGNALFKSGRTGKTEMIGVRLDSRTNNNGHVVFNADWSDGYWSSYVFWDNGEAEVFSKDGSGQVTRTLARYSRNSSGDCVIHAITGAVTVFPGFNPTANSR